MMISSRAKHIVGAFLTILMVSYFTCLSLCMHTHIINSRVVMHAHPYKSASHTHTGTEISFLGAISTFNALELDLSVDIEPVMVLLSEVELVVFQQAYQSSDFCFSLRAPPKQYDIFGINDMASL